MSLITPYQLNRFDLTQAQVDQMINELMISELEFSAKSSLFHRFFGVITGDAAGELTYIRDTASPNRSETPDKFLLNACARFAYPRVADKVISGLETHLRFSLTPHYIEEDQPFNSFDLPSQFQYTRHPGAPFLAPDWRFRTAYPGVEKMNVRPVWTTVAGYEEIDVPIYVQENLTAVLHSDGRTPIARISDTFTQNPRDVILRRSGTGAMLSTFIDNEHPLEHDVGSYWGLPIAIDLNAFNIVTERVSVQHRKYVYIDVVVPTLLTGQTFHPVYPGTNQKIPEAKPKQVVGSGASLRWRYTFWVYTLVHHEFGAEDTNLVAGEFYKLYPFISFKAFSEVVAGPQLIITHGKTKLIVEPTLTLVDEEHGIFHLNYDSCIGTTAFACLCQGWPQSVTLRYFYKTNPDFLPPLIKKQVPVLREAAAGKIASDMPTDDCGCEVQFGYIKEMQFTYSDAYIDTQTRVVVEKLRHGTTKGNMEYTVALNNTQPYRPILLPRVKN